MRTGIIMQQLAECQARQGGKERRPSLTRRLQEKRRTLAIKLREFGVRSFTPNQVRKDRNRVTAGQAEFGAAGHRLVLSNSSWPESRSAWQPALPCFQWSLPSA